MTGRSAARPWALRVAGLLCVAFFLTLVARFWHPVYGFTSFFQLDAPNDDLKITAFRELPVFVHRDTGGYDGLYYAQLAHDPSLRDPELPRAMDNMAYRARRILPPALAWVLGLGRPEWIIHTYSLLNVVTWLALAALLWRLFDVRDIHGLFAWTGVMFSAGALSSVRLALTDLVALAIIAGALLAVERGRGKLAVGLVALSGLARETSLLAVAALTKSPWFSLKNVARVALVAAPLAGWLFYVRWRVGPADAGWANFTWPGAGLVEKWSAAVQATATVADKSLAWTTLLATSALTAQAAYFLRPRLQERWWRLGAAYVGMMLFLGTAVWEGFPGAATRVLLPLTLAFNLGVQRMRSSIVWLVVGNLSVLAGLLAMRDVPRVANELTAVRLGGGVIVVTATDGWFGHEADRRHEWRWAGQRGTMEITWQPAGRAHVQLEFGLRSLTPTTVRLRHGDREIWQAAIGPVRTNHTVLLELQDGRAQLEFSSDAPATPESATPGARDLSFALYDLRFALPKP